MISNLPSVLGQNTVPKPNIFCLWLLLSQGVKVVTCSLENYLNIGWHLVSIFFFPQGKIITNRTWSNLACIGNWVFLFGVNVFRGYSLWEKLVVLLIPATPNLFLYPDYGIVIEYSFGPPCLRVVLSCFLTYPVTDEESNFIYQAVLKIQLFPVDMYQEIFLCSCPLTK